MCSSDLSGHGVLAAEQALQLALDWGVALLDLSPAVLETVQLVGLGGTGGAADAVAAGAAAQQNDGRQKASLFRMLVYRLSLNYVFRTAPRFHSKQHFLNQGLIVLPAPMFLLVFRTHSTLLHTELHY